jgi:hypothetical protein
LLVWRGVCTIYLTFKDGRCPRPASEETREVYVMATRHLLASGMTGERERERERNVY